MVDEFGHESVSPSIIVVHFYLIRFWKKIGNGEGFMGNVSDGETTCDNTVIDSISKSREMRNLNQSFLIKLNWLPGCKKTIAVLKNETCHAPPRFVI